MTVKEVFDRISQKGIELAVTDRFKARLIDEGYNPAYGARPLRRAVMRLLEDSLSEEVLSERLQSGDAAVVDVDENGKVQVLTADKFEDILKISKEKGYVKEGDLMINLTSMPVEAKGMVNTLRVSEIG